MFGLAVLDVLGRGRPEVLDAAAGEGDIQVLGSLNGPEVAGMAVHVVESLPRPSPGTDSEVLPFCCAPSLGTATFTQGAKIVSAYPSFATKRARKYVGDVCLGLC